MTKEEAIEILKAHHMWTGEPQEIIDVRKENKALEMAIQALSQEPCDDTVSIRKDALKTRVGNIVAYNVEWLKKHWQMEMDIVCGVKPCEDAISRQAVQDYIAKYLSQYLYNDVREAAEVIDEYIGELPTVNPHKSKTGHWIEKHKIIDYVRESTVRECSECGAMTLYQEKYCHKCGAKMVEPQERSDKE